MAAHHTKGGFAMTMRRFVLHRLTPPCALLAALAFSAAPAAAEECPNAAFRTGPSANLPDCRAYELVTPALKNDTFPSELDALSPDGSSALLTLVGGEAVPGAEAEEGLANDGPGTWLSVKRSAAGWTYTPDNPPASEYGALDSGGGYVGASGFQGFSLDGQTTIWSDRATYRPENSAGYYLRLPDHSIVEVGPMVPPTTPLLERSTLAEKAKPQLLGASADASHLIITLRSEFGWPFDGTSPGHESLYEYVGTGNTTPMLVGVNDRGEQLGQCGDELGTDREGSPHNAISEDGSVVFFTVRPKEAGCEGASTPPVEELFARVDNGLPDARTVPISEPSGEDCAACDTEAGVLANAHFQGASEDGSKVFFTTSQPLLPGAVGVNLYEYDFSAPAGERIVRVTNVAGDPELLQGAIPPYIEASPVISEDGSHVYFLAKSVLTATPNGEGEAAEAGAYNLYVFERDASFPVGRLAFVARLSTEDAERVWGQLQVGGDPTPDGRFFVFRSERDLTPDTTSHGVLQVFEYDAQTGGLVRVSIGQDGFNHNGNVPPIYEYPGSRYEALFDTADNAGIAVPRYHGGGGVGAQAYWSAVSVSADGSYVFFESIVGLTPQAIDRKVIGIGFENVEGTEHLPIYANNIYEFHAGRVSLISDGQDVTAGAGNSDVALLGTDESGRDVFFTTGDSLVAQDTDDNVDVYDARVDGGFPSPAASSCVGEECQGALSGAPTLLSPGSEFQAGGNPPLASAVTSKPVVHSRSACRRGMKRRSGRCVKVRAKRVKRSVKKRGDR
ncbi:MAG TPA: hypothetical protein VNV42_03425 [Solirubrobacteraceae bacterium]|jgi:hypothetical protein|nr:hypothetical protein [Solirubrobacteraceae bacterium]